MNRYFITEDSAFPWGITAGPDGAMWFAESGCLYGSCYIGRITTAGVMTDYLVPTADAAPISIAAGPDGALWFTEENAGQIGRITTSGAITEYPVPTPGCHPWGITAGPDGALWFTEALGNKIGRITTSGTVTEYPMTVVGESYPQYITTGPDGALWFTWGVGAGGVGRITTSGSMTGYAFATLYNPEGIVNGPDGNLWLADDGGNIWRVTTAGVFNEYPVPVRPSGGGTGPIALGPDGAMWFTVTCNPCSNDQIGRITTSGVITEFPVPHDGTLGGIAAGPDGALWSTITSFVLEIDSAIVRTPACALGLSASFKDTTLLLNFDLSTSVPAAWSVVLDQTQVVKKPLPKVDPPAAFPLEFGRFPNSGSVTVTSSLTDSTHGTLCSEWTTTTTN